MDRLVLSGQRMDFGIRDKYADGHSQMRYPTGYNA